MESVLIYSFIVVAITSTIVYSEGAWGIMDKVRNNKYIQSFGLLDCFLCTSFWVSLPFTLLFAGEVGYLGGFILSLGVWGLAYIIDYILNALVR